MIFTRQIYSLVIGLAGLLVIAPPALSEDTCLRCAGASRIYPDFEDTEVISDEYICFDRRRKSITSTSLSKSQFKLVAEKEGSGFDYYYWESVDKYTNWIANDELTVKIEFTDVVYNINVTHKDDKGKAFLTYVASCHLTKKLFD